MPALLFSAEAAWAQTDNKLISNIEQAVVPNVTLAAGHFNEDWEIALVFTTGDYADGYALSGVDVRIRDVTDAPTFVVSVYSTDSGRPDDSLHVMRNPASLRSGAINTFTAPAGAVLQPNTTYALVFGVTSTEGSVTFPATKSRVDSGAASGWSIAFFRQQRSGGGAWSSGSDDKPLIAIKGEERVAPAFSSAFVNGTALKVTFDRSLDPDSTLAGSAFTVTATPDVGAARTISGTSAAVTISGATANVTLASAVTEGEAVTVSYAKPASNPLRGLLGEVQDFSDQPVFNGTGDTTGPGFASATVSGDTLVVTFNERLDESSVPTAAAFQLFYGDNVVQLNGQHGQSVAISGATVTLTLDGRVPHGQAAVVWYNATYPGSSPLKDRLGNATAAFSDQPVTNNSPPVFSSAVVTGRMLTVTFDGALDEAAGSVPAAGDFAVTVGGKAASLAATNPVTVSGSRVRLKLAEAVQTWETLTVGYTPGTNRLKDADGTKAEVPGFTGKAVTNNTWDNPPRLVQALVKGPNLFLVYNEPLAFVQPDKAAFTVTVDGSTRTVDNTGLVSGDPHLTLILASEVTAGQKVRVSYNRANAGGDAKRIQDRAGNPAANFTNRAATNNTPPAFSSAAVRDSTLTITFDVALDEAAGSVPAATDFAVTVNGAAASLATTDPVAVSGRRVTLTLAAAVESGDTLTVGYTPGTNRLKYAGTGMAEVPGFTGKAVTNNTGVRIPAHLTAIPGTLDRDSCVT